MENKKQDFYIVTVSDKNTVQCPNCGLVAKLPPRTISREKLKHMQDVQRFVELREQQKNRVGLGNVRMAICLRCKQMMICRDQFTVEKKE